MFSLDRLRSYFTLRNFATFVLVLFVVHYIPWESRAGASMIKTATSVLCCFVFLVNVPYVTKALLLSVIFFLTIILSAIFHMDTFRSSTLLYLCSFLITFVTMYALVHVKHVFTLDYFITIIKRLIYTLVIVLLIQQAFIIVGIKYFPLINLCQILNRGIGANSLTMEPSVFARMMGVLLYAYMECISFRQGHEFHLIQFIEKEHKWVVIGFVWSMLTMGSGTAFIVLGVLSLYFINWRNALLVIPLIGGLIAFGSFIGDKSFNRAYNAARATATLDVNEVRKADGSASARIVPMLNTINHLDLSKKEHWFGYGIDAGLTTRRSERMVAEITDYGLLGYIIGLILVFSCAIRFFSIPTIMYFCGIGGGTGNIAYAWGILMVLMCVRYFHEKKKQGLLIIDDTDEKQSEFN